MHHGPGIGTEQSLHVTLGQAYHQGGGVVLFTVSMVQLSSIPNRRYYFYETD